MRARMAGLAAAVLLSACNEGGSSPVAHEGLGTAEAGLASPPTRTPGPVPGSQAVSWEAVPQLPPVLGATEVRWAGSGGRGLSSVSQVDVDVTLSNARRGALEVEFVSPSGLPYERRSTAVESIALDGTSVVRFSLPVAGTTVATTGMSGAWQARLFFEGEPLTTATFTLEP